MHRYGFAALAATVAAFALTAGAASAADTLNVTYYSHGNDQDFGSECCSTSSNLVQTAIGLDGLPVYNTGASNGGFVIHDLTGASNNEINWWLPANVTGTSTVTLPIANSHMFLPTAGPGGNDANGFLTAIFTGTLNLPTAEKFTFSLGSDDDAFVYIDGNVVDQLGGVHAITDAPVTTSMLSAGPHSFELFYADRNQVAAELDFSIVTEGVTLSSGTPEPASWALMMIGVGAIGFTLRQRRKAAPVTTA